MTAPRVAQQPVAHQPIQAIESLAHVGRTRGKINPRRRAKAEHTYSLSSTSTTCASVSPSKPRPTSTLRPFDNNTVNTTACFRAASGANVAANSTDTRRLASPSLRALCPGSSACLFRWRLSVLNDIPCLRQNSLRLIPLVPYKLARRTTSARPRRRTTSPDSSTMERVHHRSTALYRCVPRTLTEEPSRADATCLDAGRAGHGAGGGLNSGEEARVSECIFGPSPIPGGVLATTVVREIRKAGLPNSDGRGNSHKWTAFTKELLRKLAE